jgi:hypothetical protein
MRRALGLIGLIAVVPALCAPAQQAQLGEFVAMASQQMGVECERMRRPQAFANELAEREAEMGAVVFCDCMPTALAALGRARGSQTLITSEEFGPLVMREFDICGAQTVRTSARRDCAKLTPPGAPSTYCACFVAAVDGLTDEQIVADSIASRDNLEQRADARRNGTAEPPLQQGLLARIDEECQQPPPAR